ncbi:SNF2 family helicase, putative [Trichophyton verrucosum HKI 0517]|uniref:SNF2 family helicase, putative n=1 Tax=Trichophyton verrucosum (strain HKI 0517) TaxID=663202 RepID=D4DCX0_TRIVH|nr:SNF2 family helicase, putative [Trichophyton verrucosum HKI 0517]EFE40282.1 SNF2 family helicase, putative [Trichophyton verrucosum HKI 0517]
MTSTDISPLASPAPCSPADSHISACSSSDTSASPADAEGDQSDCDLNHYIPIGVLWWKLPDATRPDAPQEYRPEADSLQLLEDAGFIKLSVAQEPGEIWTRIQIYLIPESRVPRLPRRHQRHRRALKAVMAKIDASADAWEGRRRNPVQVNNASEAGSGCESLFYIFNTLQSPKPEAAHVSDPWSKIAITNLIYSGDYEDDAGDGNSGIDGLKTRLYPYQRRSAALMIQKEAEPSLSLDPRLQALQSPTGRTYYYDGEQGIVFDEPRFYSNVSGGILAETMGYGKTLICLAVILATRGHMPSIPSEFITSTPIRSETGSLMTMAAAAAGTKSLPWETHFRNLGSNGMYFGKCIDMCNKHRGTYTINLAPKYGNRSGSYLRDSSVTVQLTSSTLIIVPPNLVDHWLNEIAIHTEGLNVLVLRDSSAKTPPASDLSKYDIVLFSQPRFKKESGVYTGSGPVYFSPLRYLRWLRIIVDEGHNFASSGGKTNSVYMLDKLQVERRWIVSGTPSKGLYGVEVTLAAEQSLNSTSEEEKIGGILEARRHAGNILNDEVKRLDSLRSMVIDFLNLKPWANSRAADPASWTTYMTPTGPDGRRAMSPSLRATLQSLVVRHRSEDLHRELPLPSLHNEVVYLEPTCYDKASLNLFILRIVINAITSERTGDDYLFHPKNRKHLSQLMNNLRLAGFWWPGVETEEIQNVTLRVAKDYLQKNIDRMAGEELNLLHQAISIGEKILGFSTRNVLCEKEEVGILVDGFPEYAQGFWEIGERVGHQEPMLLGLSLAREAQKFVVSKLCSLDPGEGLAGAGIKARRQRYQKPAQVEKPSPKKKPEEVINTPHRPKPEKISAPKSSAKKSLPSDSSLKKTKVIGTVSAKLSYLLEKVLQFQDTEKIIIFYESENTAFWIAEGLELVGTDFRIYAHTLKASQKSEYLSTFNEGESVRVLLMDLRQASHGLHIAIASRVFIVNPIWDPNIESQAIKRAHRISQTRPVYVETLVLKDTLEDKMLRRRKAMTSVEMQHAEKDMLNDGTMSSIIQSEGFLPLPDNFASPSPAILSKPFGLFDRHTLPIPEDYVDPTKPAQDHQPELVASDIVSDSLTSDDKRRLANFLEFDSPAASQGRKSPKRRKESHAEEVVNENGIVFISPRSRTPRKQRRGPSSASSSPSSPST